MKTITFFDTKPYDRVWFDRLSGDYDLDIRYFEEKLSRNTAMIARDSDGVVAFVNDSADAEVIGTLYESGIEILALRSAGYNNVDLKAAYGKVHVVRVPDYSPNAVAEHAMALLLTLNRKIHRAYNRTRDYNFSLNGLTGFDLNGKTVGVIGTGRIGRVFVDICRGFGMQVIAHDPYPSPGDIEYVEKEELYRRSHIISLHCPLTKDTRHLISKESISRMRDGVYIINTSRGALIDSEALLAAIKSAKVAGAGLDVYEEESELFYEDFSNRIVQDDVLARLVSLPNVIVTSHQGFLTHEALHNIALSTLENLRDYFSGAPLRNEICYRCMKKDCDREHKERCF